MEKQLSWESMKANLQIDIKSLPARIFDQVCQTVYLQPIILSGRLRTGCTAEETGGSRGNARAGVRRTTSARGSTWTTTGTSARPSLRRAKRTSSTCAPAPESHSSRPSVSEVILPNAKRGGKMSILESGLPPVQKKQADKGGQCIKQGCLAAAAALASGTNDNL